MFVALIFMIKSTKKTEIDLKETLKGAINNNNNIIWDIMFYYLLPLLRPIVTIILNHINYEFRYLEFIIYYYDNNDNNRYIFKNTIK